MNEFEETKATFKKTIEKIIELKYITVSEWVSLDGIAAMFANDLYTLERENKDREEREQMFTIMQKQFPKMWEDFIEKNKVKNTSV